MQIVIQSFVSYVTQALIFRECRVHVLIHENSLQKGMNFHRERLKLNDGSLTICLEVTNRSGLIRPKFLDHCFPEILNLFSWENHRLNINDYINLYIAITKTNRSRAKLT